MMKPVLARHFVFFAISFLVFAVQWAHAQSVQLVERARPTRSGDFSANPDLLLTMNPDAPGMLQMWNWRTEKFVGPQLLFNSYEKRIYEEGRADKYNVASYEPMVGSERMSRDGRFLGMCRMFKDALESPEKTRPTVRYLAQVWDLRTGKTVAEIPRNRFKERCEALNFSPDGNTLAIAVNAPPEGDLPQSSVLFFDTSTWQEKQRTEFGPEVQFIGGGFGDSYVGFGAGGTIQFSPSGKEIAVPIVDRNLGPSAPTGYPSDYFSKQYRSLHFGDGRWGVAVIDAENGKVLARRILHWTPKDSGRGSQIQFDATGERIFSMGPDGRLVTKEQWLACNQYKPETVPEGFARENLCTKAYKARIWHWRTGQVEDLESPESVFVSDIFGSEKYPGEPEYWVQYYSYHFTENGKYILRLRRQIDREDLINPLPGGFWFETQSIEILDAQTFKVLLSKPLIPKRQMIGSFKVSYDGRFIKILVRESQYPGRQPETPYLYEILSP